MRAARSPMCAARSPVCAACSRMCAALSPILCRRRARRLTLWCAPCTRKSLRPSALTPPRWPRYVPTCLLPAYMPAYLPAHYLPTALCVFTLFLTHVCTPCSLTHLHTCIHGYTHLCTRNMHTWLHAPMHMQVLAKLHSLLQQRCGMADHAPAAEVRMYESKSALTEACAACPSLRPHVCACLLTPYSLLLTHLITYTGRGARCVHRRRGAPRGGGSCGGGGGGGGGGSSSA